MRGREEEGDEIRFELIFSLFFRPRELVSERDEWPLSDAERGRGWVIQWAGGD